jgi:transcriptional regulator with XRE-family HTH domain
MDLKQTFVKNLKEYRKEKGISQMKLAELCNSSTSYIGQIEIGNKFPSIDMVEKMAGALRIPPHLLFFGEFEAEENTEPAARYSMPDSVKDDMINQLTGAIRRIIKKQ